MTARGKRRAFIVVVGVWLTSIATGMWLLLSYQFTAGASANAPDTWPERSKLELQSDVPTLVMIAHPKCSCTRASIGELSRLMTRLQGQVRGYVLFNVPEGVDESWGSTDLWSSARLIPGISVVRDDGGVESKRFGARTSGQTYLFGADGALLFSGGITPSRSHYGDSVGRRQIIGLVTGEKHERSGSAVFGCGLDDKEPEYEIAAETPEPDRGSNGEEL